MTKTIITVAPNGQWPNKKENPAVPYDPEEIAGDVVACWERGAAIAHLHMRDEHGNGSLNVDRFRQTIKIIQDRCDIVINITTAGLRGASNEVRIQPVRELQPEMASFDCGSMNWGNKNVFLNPPDFLESLAMVMLETNTKPEIVIFDSGMISNALGYAQMGILREPLHFQFVLGVRGGMEADVQSLMYLRQAIPANATWSAFGVGKGHLPILLATLALGGHIRVGLEDNLLYAKNVPATNMSLVERAARLVREAGREIANPAETRAILGLRS